MCNGAKPEAHPLSLYLRITKEGIRYYLYKQISRPSYNTLLSSIITIYNPYSCILHSIISALFIMSRIPLKIQGITDITAIKDKSLIIITDNNETRQLSIVCDGYVRHEMAIRYKLRKNEYNVDAEKKEQIKKKLPEIFGNIITNIAGLELEVVIVSVYDGQYTAIIEERSSGLAMPIDITDGALICYANDNIQLCIEESLWTKQSVPYLGNSAPGIALPLNTLTMDMLKQALDKCIKEERYELAKHLKDEIDRREK